MWGEWRLFQCLPDGAHSTNVCDTYVQKRLYVIVLIVYGSSTEGSFKQPSSLSTS